ncbi:O-antigen ligase family protein [Thalassotalea atypica]|uniref:O-antigen ligase family protein n=1 Tax=Thalassotalea atypica TaxID=2054316 RepID=UPI002573A677|nr:O-antigen ligase family protein [Thalassotalea atypica]
MRIPWGESYIIRLTVWTLAACCMLNLNGVGMLVLGVNQLFSPVLLLVCGVLLLLAFTRQLPTSNEMQLYIISLFVYLTIGTFVAIFSNVNTINLGLVPSLLLRYFTASIVVISAFYSVFFALNTKLEPMKLLLILCVVASMFIPFGELINVSGKLVVDSQRGAGVFGNPNEASIVTAVGFALTVNIVKRKWLKLSLMLFFVAMSLLTFSKTGLMLIALIYFANILLAGNFSMAVARLLTMLVVIYTLLIFFKVDILNQFEGNQAKRVEQFLNIMLFNPSEGVVESSRGYLWRQGLDKIAQHPVLGNGLGALHSMQGAQVSVNNKVAQGVHNTYLLKIGDAGVLALIAYLGFIAVTSLRAIKLSRKEPAARFCFLYMIIFSIDSLSSHNVELLRFHNFLLGYSLALLYLAKRNQHKVYA